MGKEGLNNNEDEQSHDFKTSPTSDKRESEYSKDKISIKGSVKPCSDDEEEKVSENYKCYEDINDHSELSEALQNNNEIQYEEIDVLRKTSEASLTKHIDVAKLDVLNDKLCGDVLIRIYHKGSIQSNLICRTNLNISLLEDGNNMIPLAELDPCSIHK